MESEREGSYFEGLMQKEVLEDKMRSVMSVEVNVYTCTQVIGLCY